MIELWISIIVSITELWIFTIVVNYMYPWVNYGYPYFSYGYPFRGYHSLLASHISMYLSVASQRIHNANNVIYVETMLNLIMTLLLRCVSAGIELPYHLGHAPPGPRLHYIKHTVDWLYCSGCWFHPGSAYLHIVHILHNHSFNFSGWVRNLGIA